MSLTSVRPYVFTAAADTLTVQCARDGADGAPCTWSRDFDTQFGVSAQQVLDVMGEHSLEHLGAGATGL